MNGKWWIHDVTIGNIKTNKKRASSQSKNEVVFSSEKLEQINIWIKKQIYTEI